MLLLIAIVAAAANPHDGDLSATGLAARGVGKVAPALLRGSDKRSVKKRCYYVGTFFARQAPLEFCDGT